MKTLSAGDTIFLTDGFDMRGKAMLCHFQDIGSGDIDTGLDASKAHDTAIEPLADEGSSVRDGRTIDLLWRELIFFDPELISAVLKLAFSSCIAYRTVEGMVHQ
jgi:hypothetical protein